jgi:hypothetical protein
MPKHDLAHFDKCETILLQRCQYFFNLIECGDQRPEESAGLERGADL